MIFLFWLGTEIRMYVHFTYFNFTVQFGQLTETIKSSPILLKSPFSCLHFNSEGYYNPVVVA